MHTLTDNPTTEPFAIDTEARADWLLTKLAALDAEGALLKAQADAAVKRLQSDRESLLFRFGAELEAFAAQQVQADRKGRKSVILPHGTLAFRTVPASVRVSDPAAAIEAAKQFDMPNMVETREVLDTARYQKAAQQALQRQGCLLPGVEVTPARASFSIKFGGKGKEEAEEA
jgi:phage host-nuclease inhibitor protein Gam